VANTYSQIYIQFVFAVQGGGASGSQSGVRATLNRKLKVEALF
jgi:hypothetical protein